MNEQDKTNFATELLREIKLGARRWFIIAVVELAIIIGIIAAFLIAESRTDFGASYDISQQAGDDSANSIVGGNNYDETESSYNSIP